LRACGKRRDDPDLETLNRLCLKKRLFQAEPILMSSGGFREAPLSIAEEPRSIHSQPAWFFRQSLGDRMSRTEEKRTESPSPDAGGTNLRSVFSVGLLTTLSRILGLLRESTKAFFLGAGVAADAFQIAFLLPSAFRSLVAEGAVSSSIVPVFTPYARGEDRAEMRRVAEKYLTFWLFLVLLVTVAGVLLAGRIVWSLHKIDLIDGEAKARLTSELVRVIFWYLLLIGLAAAFQGILHAHSRFSMPALSPVLFNFSFIAVVWCAAPWMEPERQVWAFAWAVIAGGAVQFLLLAPFVWKLGVRPRLRWPFDHVGVRKMVKLLVPATFGAGIYQINVVVNLLMASRLEGDGFVASLGYSNRLMEFVLGIFVFALNTVSLTALSQKAADEDYDGYASTLGEVLRLALFITIPSTVGLFLLREEIVSLLFRSGRFDADALALTAFAFQFHVIGLGFVGASRGLVSGFYALHDVRTPVKVAAFILLVNAGLAYSLSTTNLGHAGIALASTISAVVQVMLLAWILRRRVAQLRFGPVLSTLARACLAAAVMGALVFAGRFALDPFGPKWLLGLGLAGVIAAGAGVYFFVAEIVGLEEGKRVLGALSRRRRRLGD